MPQAFDEEHPVRSVRKGRVRKMARGTGTLFNFIFKTGLVISFVVVGLLFGGFLKFTSMIAEDPNISGLEYADGIVVLTGGPSRLASGLELLSNDKAQRLLVSGVHPKTTERALQNLTRKDASLFECCVDIDREAADTIGNARQAAIWADEHGFKSLIVVTNAYHMPRSMLEMRRAMPDLPLQALPIPLKMLDDENWYLKPSTLRFVVSEYGKYLGARLRPVLSKEKLSALKASLVEVF